MSVERPEEAQKASGPGEGMLLGNKDLKFAT